MIDHDNLEEFRDPQTYDLQDEGYYDDYPLTEQWARSLGGPLLDLACGTGRMAFAWRHKAIRSRVWISCQK